MPADRTVIFVLLFMLILGRGEGRATPPGVHILRSTVPGAGFEDLAELDSLVASARILGIGEATHGTSEFATMRWRFMEYLAEHHGFRLFLMEADLIATEKLDAFVVRGEGDPYALVTEFQDWGQEWGKSVQERVELLLWAREFNRGRADPVHFAGFDAKRLDRAMDAAVSALRSLSVELALDIEDRYLPFRELDKGNVARSPAVTSMAIAMPEGIPGRVTVSGWIRTEGVERGWAGIALGVVGEEGILARGRMGDGPAGTTSWRRYEVSAEVPREATRLFVDAYSVGTGTTWFNDLEVMIDEGPPAPVSGDWDAQSTEGLLQHGPSHDIELDTGRSSSEATSLKVTYRPALIDEAMTECKGIVSEIEEIEVPQKARRQLFRAIQYARMVVQALEFRDMHAVRDRAMAENVRWWLEQYPPGTKAVLGASLNHTSRMGTRLGKLGDHLAEWYGDEYRPIAMTTYSGTYLAEGDEGPGIHRLPLAPDDSVEAVLHSLGFAILAIDFAKLDPGSDTGRLLLSPIKRRAIGLTHRENHFATVELSVQFDGLLFIDTTSHTRLLPQADY